MSFDFRSFIGSRIDGRPLHRYRISDRRFDELQVEARRALAGALGDSAAATFVLWASEYYRREFDGGAFSWSFLLEPLELVADQNTLRDLTDRGLRLFHRPAPRRNEGGIQYLKTLAAEGGLPVRLLSSTGGYRAALVGLVTDLERFGVGCPQDQAIAFARRRAARLPFGYRTDEFAEIFVQFAREIVELRARLPEGLAVDRVESWLDTAQPDWREALTLRLDGAAASGLLAEAMVISTAGELSEPLQRQLIREEDGVWQPMVDVAPITRFPPRLLDGIGPQYRRVRLGPKGPLATACPDLLLSLEREDEGGAWICTRISSRRTATFSLPLSSPLDLVAMADGRVLDEIKLPGGAIVDPTEGLTLWTLSETGEDGRARRIEYAGSASLRTRDPHVWGLVAQDAKPNVTDGLGIVADGHTTNGRLFRLEGEGRIGVRDWSARIKTEADATERDEITAIGPRHPLLRDERGDPVFRGVPDLLYRQAGRAFASLPSRKRHFRLGGQRLWSRRAPDELHLGVLDVAADEQGNVGARLRLRVLPSGAQIEPVDGGLRFSGFPPGWSIRVADAAAFTVDTAGSAVADLPESVRLKDRVPFVAAAPDASQTIQWQLSLPRRLGFFADTEGALLNADRGITLHALRKWRIVPARYGQTELSLRLMSHEHSGMAPRLTLPVPTEVPLSSFRRLIEDLLAQGGPEAEVRLRVLSGPEQSHRLAVRRFRTNAELFDIGVLPSHPGGQDAGPVRRPELVAVDLDRPNRVVPVVNETKEAMGKALGPGRWFFLSSLDGEPMRPPRPLFINQSEASGGCSDLPESIGRLSAAASGRTRDERVNAYAGVLSTAAEEEIKTLETAIEALMAHGVSPAALDQALALDRCPDVAVRFLLRGEVSGLTDRLDLEHHGARRWAFVSPEDWGRGLLKETEILASGLRAVPALAEKADRYAREQVGHRIREILVLRPDLDGHIALGLMSAGLAQGHDLDGWLGRMPPAFGDPEGALTSQANTTVSRNGDRELTFPDLRAAVTPASFHRFGEHARGLIEAPLFVAEIAFGRRSRPDARVGIQLLHAMHIDSGYFDVALPAAMAWHKMRVGQ